MRIIHIEDFFHPDAGYQINILSKYQVKQGHEVTIFSSEIDKIPERLKFFFGTSDIMERDTKFTKSTGVNIVRIPIFKYYSGRAIYSIRLFRLIDALNPDILFIHGNDSYAGIIYTLFYKKLKYPIIMDNHMLEMATSNKFNKLYRWSYRNLLAKVITKNRIKVIRVQDDDFIIKNLKIPIYLAPIIPLGTDTLQFHPDEDRKREIRMLYNIDSTDFVVLYMGKITEDKGVMLLIKALMKKFKIKRKIILVLVGNISSEYGKKVEAELQASENPYMRFPTQRYPDLPDFYHLSDVAVFPRHCSLSFFDAQACGVPVILEDNGLNLSRVTMNNGLIFKSEDSADLRDKIQYLAEWPYEKFHKMKQASVDYIYKNKLDYATIADQYSEVINESINEFDNLKKRR